VDELCSRPLFTVHYLFECIVHNIAKTANCSGRFSLYEDKYAHTNGSSVTQQSNQDREI